MPPKRIIPTPLPAYVIPIAVTASWNSAQRAATDIETATGFPIVGIPVNLIYDLYFELWAGYDDPYNFASLKFDVSVPSYEYKDIMGGSTPWTTHPLAGDVAYLLMTRVKK